MDNDGDGFIWRMMVGFALYFAFGDGLVATQSVMNEASGQRACLVMCYMAQKLDWYLYALRRPASFVYHVLVSCHLLGYLSILRDSRKMAYHHG